MAGRGGKGVPSNEPLLVGVAVAAGVSRGVVRSGTFAAAGVPGILSGVVVDCSGGDALLAGVVCWPVTGASVRPFVARSASSCCVSGLSGCVLAGDFSCVAGTSLMDGDTFSVVRDVASEASPAPCTSALIHRATTSNNARTVTVPRSRPALRQQYAAGCAAGALPVRDPRGSCASDTGRWPPGLPPVAHPVHAATREYPLHAHPAGSAR